MKTYKQYTPVSYTHLDVYKRQAAKRMQLLHDAENRMIVEQAYFIPLVTNTQVMLKKPSVKGLERTPAAMFYFEHVTIE